jgi:hypothetical protein
VRLKGVVSWLKGGKMSHFGGRNAPLKSDPKSWRQYWRHNQNPVKQLSSAPYNFKMKGLGEVNLHFGFGFERDSDGVLCMNPSQYINKIEGETEPEAQVPPSKRRSSRTRYIRIP